MIMKCLKYGSIAVVAGAIVGGLVFGRDLASYVRSSAKSVQTAVKDKVPIEFELQRARDMVDQIIPELQANILLIAREEVEIGALNADIAESQENVADERQRIAKIRNRLDSPQVVFTFNDRQFTRRQVTEDLGRRFERFKQSEMSLAAKQRLLETRQNSLHAAMDMLDGARSRKADIEQAIEGLTAQHRLVQAASVGSGISVDDSKLAQTQKLITQIKRRLDVAERVLAHESQFVQAIPVDVLDEKDLLVEVDDYFSPGAQLSAATKVEPEPAPELVHQTDSGTTTAADTVQ